MFYLHKASVQSSYLQKQGGWGMGWGVLTTEKYVVYQHLSLLQAEQAFSKIALH